MYQAQMPLPGFPIVLSLFSNGTIAFTPMQKFSTIIDMFEGGVKAIFSNENFELFLTETNKEVYNYNCFIEYKEESLLLQWLKQQNLQQPQ